MTNSHYTLKTADKVFTNFCQQSFISIFFTLFTPVVLFSFFIFSISAWIYFSDVLSNADVASSNINIFGFLKNILAIAILYLWPPDKLFPPSEIKESNFSSNPFI